MKETPKGIPENWVVNPHNNRAVDAIVTIVKDKDSGEDITTYPHIRENWINPEALDKICPETTEGKCTHKRETNAYYIEGKDPGIKSSGSE